MAAEQPARPHWMPNPAKALRRALLLFVIFSVAAITVMLSLAGDRHVQLELRGNQVSLELGDSRDFVFEVGQAQLITHDPQTGDALPPLDLLPEGSAATQTYRVSAGTRVTLQWEPRSALLMVRAAPVPGRSPAPPKLGAQEIPFHSPLLIDRSEAAEIALLRGYGAVRLGEHASSNGQGFLAGGSYRFVERVFGGADVVTLEGQIDPFDVVSLAQRDSDSPLLADLLVDLTQLDKGMGLYVEAGNRGLRPVLMIERRIGHDPTPLEPGPIGRALAHPLARYLTLLAGIALVFLQLLSVPGTRAGAAPSEPLAAPPRSPEPQPEPQPLAPPDPPPLTPTDTAPPEPAPAVSGPPPVPEQDPAVAR